MPRINAILINVTDMDKAIDFYCDKMDFEVESKKYYPKMVQLDHEGAFLILYKVDKIAHIDYPDEVQTLINFESKDLNVTLARLKGKGVELLHEKPQPCPVGVYAAFRDPFGNVHEILEFRD